jgi:valyl-tRNA synthetase
MSKSKGTGLDPVVLNQQYGTDAMRFCLASMAAPGTDIILSDDRLASSRNFANKIWNAARFLFVNLDKFEQSGAKLEELAAPEVRARAPYKYRGELELVDGWLFNRLAVTASGVKSALENYRFHEAAQDIYQFFWGDFCDWYIEWVKPELQSPDRERAIVAWRNLFAVFDAALRLLHPFMPFLTEELWHQLPQKDRAKSIALDSYPEPGEEHLRVEFLMQFQLIQEIIVALRNIRSELRIDPKKKVGAELFVWDELTRDTVNRNCSGVVRLAMLSQLKISDEPLTQTGDPIRSTSQFDVRIAYSEAVDVEAERARLKKEIEGLQKAIASKEKQLADETFRTRAPEKIIKGLEATLAGQRIELQKLQDRLDQLDKGV